MKCPVCDHDLTPVTLHGVTVDVCDGGCGGAWFDNFEVEKFLAHPDAACGLAARVKAKPEGFFDRTKRHRCPRCTDVVMMRHFFNQKRHVEVDVCPGCNGRWLDEHELARICREARPDPR